MVVVAAVAGAVVAATEHFRVNISIYNASASPWLGNPTEDKQMPDQKNVAELSQVGTSEF